MVTDKPSPVLPRDCYNAATVRHMLGTRDDKGQVQILHPRTLSRWRQAGRIAFVVVTPKYIVYPKASIDAMIAAGQSA